jgi:cytoskeleton-associated protein 5
MHKMDDEENHALLPLTDRATHKLWKVRLGAYEEMRNQFILSKSETDPCFRPFIDNPGLYKQIVTDSNVVAQETGLATLAAMLEYGGSTVCLRLRPAVVAAMIEKSLGSSRAGTRKNCLDALLWFIELDTPDPIVDELLPYLNHRMPKLVAGATNALTEIFRLFGTSTVSPKNVIKAVPKLFSHADSNVRKEATALVIELYKWLGDGVKSAVLPALKPVQQKELDAEFEKVKAQKPQQERILRSQREAMERQASNGISAKGFSSNQDAEEEEEGSGMLDLIEPIEVRSKIPADFATRLASSKWKDRKEVLEEFYPMANVPRIKHDDYGDVIRLLAKCMKDANIQVVALAANIIECFAKGLRRDFVRYIPFVLSPMLERLKEKKVHVTEALRAALIAVFNCTTLSEILDETLEFLKHKTPQVKIETLIFLTQCLSTTKIMPKASEIKSITEATVSLLGDTQEPVRNCAAEVVGVVMKLAGERAINPYLESIDEIKRGKIKEYFQTVEVKAKAGPVPVPGRPIALVKGSRKPAPPLSRKRPLATDADLPNNTSRRRLESMPKSPPPARPSFNRPLSPTRPSHYRSTLQGRGLTGRVCFFFFFFFSLYWYYYIQSY